MTLPGIPTMIGDNLPKTTSLASSSGTAFIVGEALRGPTNVAIPVLSMPQYESICGDRVAFSPVYDTLDIAFDRGLTQAYFVRAVGPDAAVAKGNLLKGEAEKELEVLATSAGEWGNAISVEVVENAAKRRIRVLDGTELVAASPELETNAALVAWAEEDSGLIKLVQIGAGLPKAQKVTLSGGDDDRESIDAEVIAECLTLFTTGLGRGQVAVPGNTDEDVQLAVIAHCDETWRNPFLDVEDTGEFSDIVAAALALRSADGARQGGMFDPWDIAKGLSSGTTRTVPPCARQLGAVAAVDGITGNASEPAAGENGQARKNGLVIGLARIRNDAEREALNDAGVNVSIIEDGVVTTMGWRTLADPVSDKRWLALNVARVMTGIAYDTRGVLKRFLFKRTDAAGKTRAAAESACQTEVIKPLYEGGALFGATEAEAGSVSVTQQTNPTDGSIAKFEADVGAAPVEFAEQIPLTVVATN